MPRLGFNALESGVTIYYIDGRSRFSPTWKGHPAIAIDETVYPDELTYSANPAIYTVGLAIADNEPSSTGGAVDYSIAPALPAGLSLDRATGVISGTPAEPSAATEYTVTAANSGGSTTARVTITVKDAAPSALVYSTNPAIYTVGLAITDNEPVSMGGAVVAYSIVPALPAGLSLDRATGVISGTPAELSAATEYTVTAANSGGSTTAVVSITLVPSSHGEFGLFAYKVVDDSVVITGYLEIIRGNIDIPEGINGKPVTTIGIGAFAYQTGLTSITVPSSVTIMGKSAFESCSSLTSITIPSVTIMGKSAFESCSSLTSITILSSLTSIGESAFAFCYGLTSISIPSGVTFIDDSVFTGCSGLTSISIPSGVTSIGTRAFTGCFNLTSITLPSSLTSIGYGAFDGCESLTSIILPSSLTSIGYGAFEDCFSLTSITIPSSVTSIGEWAFADCTELTNIILFPGVTSIGRNAFDGCTGLRTVVFLGDAPRLGSDAFENGVTIYYIDGRSGFSSPTWKGYPAIAIDETVSPDELTSSMWQFIP